LISNAGTPTLSDPGFKLVRASIEEKIKIQPIPGASAVLTALVASGLPTDKFLFLGFLPKKKSKREKILANLPPETTIIFFESPHRLLKTLNELQMTFGNLQVVAARELTKLHQEIRREKIIALIDHFRKIKPRGEFTLLLRLP